mgnify:CR=1 FL=1
MIPSERYYHELLDNSLLYFHHSAADLATRDRLLFRALMALLLPLRKIDIHPLGLQFQAARKLFMVRKKAVSPPPPPPMVVPYAHAKRLAEVVMVLMTIDKQLKKAKKDKNKGSQDPTLIKDRRARKLGSFFIWPNHKFSLYSLQLYFFALRTLHP